MRFRQFLLLSVSGALILSGCKQAPQESESKAPPPKAEAIAVEDIVSTTPIVLPGAPGQSARTLSAAEAIKIADNSYSPDDVSFMQNMIPHHAQAVEMAALVETRTNRKELVDIAGRIDASQADEIKFMQDWLKDRGESLIPSYGSGHDGHDMSGEMKMDGVHQMEGMASPEDMKALAGLEGTDFDRKFLTLMIAHHEGAVTMVDNLTDQPGSAYDPVLYDFTNDIVNDQEAEIERMGKLLSSLSSDNRVGLSAGFNNAGQAARHMKLDITLSKPAGFFDPKNPSGMPPIIEKDDNEAPSGDDQGLDDTEWGERSPLLSFSNTDMAFAGDIMVAGSYHGFNVYKLQKDGLPKLYSSVVCPGGQGDVSIVGDLLIMSVEQTRGRVDCGLQGIADDISDERFRGLRIFDISDLAAPVQVGQVQTCRGSHTHSVVTSDANKIVVYNSGTSSVRDEEELAGCIGRIPGDNRTALFRIDVIEIPVTDPSKSRIVDSPTVFADESGNMAGLWQGGDHGEGTQRSSQTNQCHDITVFPSANIAAGACSGNGIIFDISNPLKPKRIDEVVDKGFAYWHSATFNNDGTKVIFTDEWGGGSRPRCRVYDPKDWGANAVYDIVNQKLEFKGYYKLPAPQSDSENCVAHNGSVVPVPGRDIFVQAWYQGGVSVIDFTDSSNPVEIAYFDRGPIHESKLQLGGYWSTYWYGGKIYGTEIARGLDVLSLEPSEYLTANEIASASLANQGDVFNPQQQFPVSWPADPVIARAYMDQLKRVGALSDEAMGELDGVLKEAASKLGTGTKDTAIADKLQNLVREMSADNGDAMNRRRLSGLADTLGAIANELN